MDLLSADAELQGKLPIIRSRSRDLERNDPYVENYLKLRENNVVGHDGFTLQMKVKLSEDLDPATGEMVVKYDTVSNRKIERGWKRFCRKNNFLTTRDLNATEACKLIERSIGRDGSILIRKVRGYPNEFGFALQLMEVDYLDDQFIDFRGVACDCPNELRLPDGRPFPYCKTRMHEVRMGVELHGDWMFPVAYWLLAKHPGDYFFGNQFDVRRTRVPVDEIIHPFVHRRAGQTREVPATVAAMLRLQMLGGYDEATLVKARAAAQKMGFLEKEIPDSVADQFMDEWKDAFGDQAVINGEPGQIEELPMGVKFKPWDPQEPTGNYAPFQKTQLRGAACAMGVSYSSLANDPSDSNFSATKIGMMEEREGYRGGQEFFISIILDDVFAAWLPCAMLSGQVDLPFSRLEEFLDAEAVCFGGRSFPWLDPEKDISAAILAIDNGLATRAETIRDGTANDFEEVTAELGREKKLRQAAGIQPPDEAPPQPQEPDKQPDPDDEGAARTATKNVPVDEPRDEDGKWTPVGKEGDWQSLGLSPAENIEPIARPARMTRDEAMAKLSTPYVKEDPLGNAVGFGSRLKGHLDEHIREGDHARPGFLPHMEAAVENPAEIWQENMPQGPRLRHITAFQSSKGTLSFAVVSHQLGETRATIITGTPQRHAALNKHRRGKLLYVRPRAK